MNTRAFVIATLVVILISIPSFFIPLEEGAMKSESESSSKLFEAKNSAQNAAETINLEKLWARYEVLEPSPVEEPSPEETAQQSVKQQEVKIDKTLLPNFSQFDDAHQIGLVAIFHAEQSFALVELLNYESRESQFKKLTLNEKLFAFELIEIQESKVLFKNNNDTLQLQLFR